MGKIKISLARRVERFFTRNPEEELTSVDIAEKFNTDIHGVPWQLTQALRNGTLARAPSRVVPIGETFRRCTVYIAGPSLLKDLGLSTEANAPVANVQATAGRR